MRLCRSSNHWITDPLWSMLTRLSLNFGRSLERAVVSYPQCSTKPIRTPRLCSPSSGPSISSRHCLAQRENASYHSELGLSLNFLGCLYDDARRNTEAVGTFQQAVAEQQLAADLAKKDHNFQGYLGNHLTNLGEQFDDLGRVALALPVFRRAVGIFREINAGRPSDRVYALEVLKSLVQLGTAERYDGDAAAARNSFAELRTTLDRWSADAPDDTALRILLGAALEEEASALFDEGKSQEAKERLERALLILRPQPDHETSVTQSALERRVRRDVLYVMGIMQNDGDAATEERRWRSETLWDLARVQRALELREEAEKSDRERALLWKDRPPGEQVDVALSQLDRALVIGYGKTPVSDRAGAVRELDLNQAAANLKSAIARGFRDIRKLSSHPGSEFLLSREDLKLPLMDIAFPDRPFTASSSTEVLPDRRPWQGRRRTPAKPPALRGAERSASDAGRPPARAAACSNPTVRAAMRRARPASERSGHGLRR